MTVKELREQLATFQDDVPVVLSRDEEGNGFHELADVAFSAFIRDDGRIEVLSAEDEEDEDAPSPEGMCVVLWP